VKVRTFRDCDRTAHPATPQGSTSTEIRAAAADAVFAPLGVEHAGATGGASSIGWRASVCCAPL
jgi:hypothetical protein